MLRIRRAWLLAPALFITTALLASSADGGLIGAVSGQKDKKDKDKDAKEKDAKDGKEKDGKFDPKGPKADPGKATKELRKAYDQITDVAQAPVSAKEATRVLDHAKRFYREAVKAYPDDPRRSVELAAAANDSVRGLEHLQRANAKPVAGLPEPPADFASPFGGPKGKGPPAWNAAATAEPGPWTESLEALSAARERLAWTDGATAVNGPARDLMDSAKAVYEQARTAYEGREYRKAAQLARAAEAWSHVPEHLIRAGWEAAAAPEGSPAPRVKDSGAPPAPPPIKP
jgi:hypothetical protein